MTLNPIKALKESFEELIIEHGSAKLHKEHIVLLKDHLSLADREITKLIAENSKFKSKELERITEINKLRTEIMELKKENEYLQNKIQKHEQPHSILLDKEKTDILLYLHKHIGDSFTFQIAQALNLSETIVKYHLQELLRLKFIGQGLPDKPGLPWHITDKGTKYLIENKLIS